MSDKALQQLWEADRQIRQACPYGMDSGLLLRIDYYCGFELFNTRPYHNYETWSSGYQVAGPVVGTVSAQNPAWQQPALAPGLVVANAEDLDDAFRLWVQRRAAARDDALEEKG